MVFAFQSSSSPACARRPLRRTSAFTLIELLVVIAIAAFLMSMAMPAFEKLAIGQGVNAGASMVGAQLRMARQTAIANRQYVALLMPAGENDPKSYSSMRMAIVDKDGTNWKWKNWVPGSKWEFLPPGSVIAEVSNKTVAVSKTYIANTVTSIPNTDWPNPTCTSTIVFRPTGKTQNGPWFVRLFEGFRTGNDRSPRGTSDNNMLILKVDQYTGRVSHLTTLPGTTTIQDDL